MILLESFSIYFDYVWGFSCVAEGLIYVFCFEDVMSNNGTVSTLWIKELWLCIIWGFDLTSVFMMILPILTYWLLTLICWESRTGLSGKICVECMLKKKMRVNACLGKTGCYIHQVLFGFFLPFCFKLFWFYHFFLKAHPLVFFSCILAILIV